MQIVKTKTKGLPMNQATKQSVLFPELFSKPCSVEFSDERLSGHGGAVLLSACEARLGLLSQVADCIVDTRQAGKVKHTIKEQLMQRVFGLALGYEDCNDASVLCEEPILKLSCGRDPFHGERLASQPTLSRFENSLDSTELYRMSLAIGTAVLEAVANQHGVKKVKQLIIDIDPTDDPTYGAQQLSLFNGYYDTHCYLPLIVTLSVDSDKRKYPLAAILRSGTAGSMVGTLSVLKRLVPMIKSKFTNAAIALRADSAFASPELFKFLDENKLQYAIAMKSNNVLKRCSSELMIKAREETKVTQEKATFYGKDIYKSSGWKRERNVAYKAEVVVHPLKETPRDNERFVVYNLSSIFDPEKVFSFYYGHSNMENCIKELKLDLSLGRTSCTDFKANQFRVLMTLCAYILTQWVAIFSDEKELQRAQISTIRKQLFSIAAIVRSTVRRFRIIFTTHHPWQRQWLRSALALGASFS